MCVHTYVCTHGDEVSIIHYSYSSFGPQRGCPFWNKIVNSRKRGLFLTCSYLAFIFSIYKDITFLAGKCDKRPNYEGPYRGGDS